MSDKKELPKNYVKVQEGAQEARARNERLDVYANVGKVSLIDGALANNYKTGKSAGFYCQTCDMTLKDSIQYTDHINSKQHLHNAGLKEASSRATVQDVRKRLAMLRKKKQDQQQHEEYDIKKRLEAKRQLDEKVRQQRRKRRSKRKT